MYPYMYIEMYLYLASICLSEADNDYLLGACLTLLHSER